MTREPWDRPAEAVQDTDETEPGCQTQHETVGTSTWVWCTCFPDLKLSTTRKTEAEQLDHLHHVQAVLSGDLQEVSAR